ncbi:MAG: YfhO family protein, partial [Bacteroidota bacterium]
GNANTKVIAVVNTARFQIDDSEGYFSGGTIDLVQNKPNHLIYDIDAAGNAFAVFSEIYYPNGWTATIDGEEVEIIQANYVLRALEIPEGKHRVEFRYAPDSYTIGNKVMWAANILLILSFFAVGFQEWRKMSKE